MLLIRNATIRDLDVITAVEAACFSPAEAATRDTLADRLHRYPDHFWLLFEDETLVSFLDGFVTDLPDLTDDPPPPRTCRYADRLRNPGRGAAGQEGCGAHVQG